MVTLGSARRELENSIGGVRGIQKNTTIDTSTGQHLTTLVTGIRETCKSHDLLHKLCQHDLGGTLVGLQSIAHMMTTLPQERLKDHIKLESLQELLHHAETILWSMMIGTSSGKTLERLVRKTVQTIKISEFLGIYLRFILIPHNRHPLSSTTDIVKLEDIKKRTIEGIMQDGEDRVFSLLCPADLALFIRSAVSNALNRGGAEEVALRWNGGMLSILDNGKGIDKNVFEDANYIFVRGKTGSSSTGLGMRDLEKRNIRATAEHHGGLETHERLSMPVGNRGAAIHIVLQAS